MFLPKFAIPVSQEDGWAGGQLVVEGEGAALWVRLRRHSRGRRRRSFTGIFSNIADRGNVKTAPSSTLRNTDILC